MNKALYTAVMAVAALSAAAEGYQVNTFSAKQIGMGHVGVAMKLGAESQISTPPAWLSPTRLLSFRALWPP